MGLFDAFKKKNSSTIVISTAPEPGPTEAKITAIEDEEETERLFDYLEAETEKIEAADH